MRTLRIPFDWITIYCNSVTAVFIPISPWMDASDIAFLRQSFELRAIVGNLQAQAAYQTANDTRSPDSATGFGNTKSSAGFEDPSSLTDVKSTFEGKEKFRLGFLVSNTSGSSFSAARVRGTSTQIKR